MKRVVQVNDEVAKTVEGEAPVSPRVTDREVGAAVKKEFRRLRSLGTGRGISPDEGRE